MIDQTSSSASGINKLDMGVVQAPDLKVDVKSLPAKTPKKIISSKRKVEKAAKTTLKDFKKGVKRELRNTYKVTSLLDFALKNKEMITFNLEGTINKAYQSALSRLNSRKNLTAANKQAAGKLFGETVNNLRAFKLGESVNEENLLLGKGKKKVSNKKVVSAKDKKLYKSDPLKSLHKAATDLHAVGAMNDKEKANMDKACLKKESKKKSEKEPKAAKKAKGKKADKPVKVGEPEFGKLDNHQPLA